MADSEDAGKTYIHRMTKKAIEQLSKKNKLYITPHLNDVLYLHFQGFDKIECLEEYTGVKCLWLENNGFSEITGLHEQKNLRCLYLQHNFIKKIENLENCRLLDTLNVSHNFITEIENCSSDVLPELNTLNISYNKLSTAESIRLLAECKWLSVLDLSYNRIDDVLIVDILGAMASLHVLTLTGNPVVNEIPSYRKVLIVKCVGLTYLDQRPVSDKDRACAVAWKRGGYEEEKCEMIRWEEAQRRKTMDSVMALITLRNGGKEEQANIEYEKEPIDEDGSGDTDEEEKPEELKLDDKLPNDVEKSMNPIDDPFKNMSLDSFDESELQDISDAVPHVI